VGREGGGVCAFHESGVQDEILDTTDEWHLETCNSSNSNLEQLPDHNNSD